MGGRAESRLAVLLRGAAAWLRGLQPGRAGLTVLGSAGAAGKATAATASNDSLVSPRRGDVAGPCRRRRMTMFVLLVSRAAVVVVVLLLLSRLLISESLSLSLYWASDGLQPPPYIRGRYIIFYCIIFCRSSLPQREECMCLYLLCLSRRPGGR